jgi:glycosyltransferase involved in cell wall biosynthesis
MKTVVVINRVLKHYRAPFYVLLKKYLAQDNIDLKVIHGKADNLEALSKDSGHLDWAIEIDNVKLPLGFYWQPCWRYLAKADLVIVEQASKFSINYFLMAKRLFSKQKVAFIGHGLTRIKPENSISNIFKVAILKNVDWWFAYTQSVAKLIISRGFPEKKVTVFQNSIDTKELIKAKQSLSQEKVDACRNSIGLGNGPVGIFCGGMYEQKRIRFLLDACKKIKEILPEFEMIFLGGGPDTSLVAKEARENKWIHHIGPCFGHDRIPYFLLADVFLMPGLVGLAILDSFVLETPIITTDYLYHSPEVDYIKDGVNGVIVSGEISSYVAAVGDILTNKNKLDKLKAGCRNSANKYNIQDMAERFTKGILDCLERK